MVAYCSLRLEPAVDELIEATMLHLSTVEEVKDIDLLALGTTVPVAFSEARFQVKKSACFWRHGRYQE